MYTEIPSIDKGAKGQFTEKFQEPIVDIGIVFSGT